MTIRKKVSIAALGALLSMPLVVSAAEMGRDSRGSDEGGSSDGYYKDFKSYDRWAVAPAATDRGGDFGTSQDEGSSGGYYRDFKPSDRWAVVTVATHEEGMNGRETQRSQDWRRRMWDDWQ